MRKENVINLYFDKHRIATLEDLEPIEMTFDFDQCCFKAVTNELSKAVKEFASGIRNPNNKNSLNL